MTVKTADMSMVNNETAAPVKRRFFLAMPKRADRSIFISILVLALFGLLMIASSSMGLTVGRPGRLALILIKQIVFLGAGYYFMARLANNFKLSFLKTGSFPVWAIGIGAALLFCLAFPAAGGARAWIRVPISGMDISIQPSEFAKVMVILIVAAYCGDVKKIFDNPGDIIRRPLVFIVAYVGIVLILQSDMGSAVVIFMIALICLMIPQHPQLRLAQRFLRFMIIAGALVVLYILSPFGEAVIRRLPLKAYQINRFLSALNPFVDMYDTGFQLVNGLVSFATGGWFGLGYGNSVRKYTQFPAANTDFILAIVVEELGLVGFLVIFIPYMIIIVQLFRYAMKIQSEQARVILIGTAMYLVIHCLFNIGGVTGMIPLTGVPLLMISSGGSSTLAFMIAVGISQAVIDQYRKGAIQ
ncbi:MAG: FtsW/RodA/SpoVE family cell cycle protein [Solobacterium sp.]|nr:FtsW/RodA/SpoVE family cell cycle protein [Solobacterium sp.]